MVRTMLLAFCNAIVLIGVVVAIIDGTGDQFGQLPVSPVLLVVVLVGLLGQLAFPLVRRPLDCTDSSALARSYLNRRLFSGLAISEAPALVGFLGFLLTSKAWLYPLGAVFTAIGFARTAPTRAQPYAEEAQLVAAGFGESLIAALIQHRPGRS